MKAKVKLTGEIVDVIDIYPAEYEIINGEPMLPFAQYYRNKDKDVVYRDDDLDFNLDPPQPEVSISGWVAKDDFGQVAIYHSKPRLKLHHIEESPYWDCDTTYPDGYKCYSLYAGLFPDMEDLADPIEVEITIKPKKQ